MAYGLRVQPSCKEGTEAGTWGGWLHSVQRAINTGSQLASPVCSGTSAHGMQRSTFGEYFPISVSWIEIIPLRHAEVFVYGDYKVHQSQEKFPTPLSRRRTAVCGHWPPWDHKRDVFIQTHSLDVSGLDWLVQLLYGPWSVGWNKTSSPPGRFLEETGGQKTDRLLQGVSDVLSVKYATGRSIIAGGVVFWGPTLPIRRVTSLLTLWLGVS